MNALMDPEPKETPQKETDEDLILHWYRQAAFSDDNQRQAVLCADLQDGPDWYFTAANNGDKYAQYALGMMYLHGKLMPQNSTKAAMWLSKAARSDICFACYESAKLCDAGIGIDRDPDSANQLYQKAFRLFSQAEQKSPNPQIERSLAEIYEKGLGRPKDENLAGFWRMTASNATGGDVIEENGPQQDYREDTPEEEPSIKLLKPAKTEKQKKNVIPLFSAKKSKAAKTKPAKEKRTAAPQAYPDEIQDFLDMIMPSAIDFSHQDFFVCGNTFRCVWVIREYPTSTEDKALLKELGEMNGVTLRIYTRPVTPFEERKLFLKAERKNRFSLHNAHSIQDSTEAADNLNDMEVMAKRLHQTKEKLMHCAVFLELVARSIEDLTKLQNDVISFFARTKIVYDRLWIQQKEGFLTMNLFGSNKFKSQFERILPSSSVANLYPFCYSGKTDPDGMFIGRDVDGTNIIVNFDRRSLDKTNGHILILGNTGEGKSYLLKLIITLFRQMGKKFYILDPDDEYKDLTENTGGCYIDMMAGKYFINVLEPRLWTDKADEDKSAPAAFRKKTRLSQHIAYLRDFFQAYKHFPSDQLDTLEILLEKLYRNFSITDETDFEKLQPEDYPILSDLFALAQNELEHYGEDENRLYTKDLLRTLTLGLREICVGSESTFFNGHTNITNADFIDFSVKDMLSTNENLKNAMFMNILSYMSHKFLTEGAAEIAIDELHLFLGNKIAIDYIRSFSKRGRKKDSGIILASQNVEDFMLPEVISYTKPLLSIPTHSFLFHPGDNCDVREFQRLLSVRECEYDLIAESHQGYCLYKCGTERYHLHVEAPEYKAELFGAAGGK
ncbi:ATP-binding protein [Caproicibacter fermentans]|uniref:SEL1-like repeat protein n=1 Tax=Caproicibacter fermentans TaxID=2576756 RepID=A0A7G8TD67_9FIRM|nr:SEL1-like repeat protein [Caproicibacter fermentans]